MLHKSASDFIRSLPTTLSVQEVMDAGERAGLKFKRQLVYAVRSMEKGKTKIKRKAKVAKTVIHRRAQKRSVSGSSNAIETQFRKLALRLGIKRAEEILGELKQRLKNIVRGLS